MTPVVIAHFIVFVTYFIGILVLPFVAERLDLIGAIIYQELVSMAVVVYAPTCITAIALDLRAERMRRKRTLKINNANAGDHQQQQRHFDELRKSWM
jgi:hypothetical protein